MMLNSQVPHSQNAKVKVLLKGDVHLALSIPNLYLSLVKVLPSAVPERHLNTKCSGHKCHYRCHRSNAGAGLETCNSSPNNGQ